MKHPHTRRLWRCVWAGALAILTLMAGCTAAPTPAQAFYLEITNQCSDAVLAIYHEYALAGRTLGDGGVQNSDGQPLSQGEVLSLEFTSQNFSGETDLSAFSVQLYVVLDDGDERPVGGPITLAAAYGQTYAFGITGNRNTGFAWTAQ